MPIQFNPCAPCCQEAVPTPPTDPCCQSHLGGDNILTLYATLSRGSLANCICTSVTVTLNWDGAWLGWRGTLAHPNPPLTSCGSLPDFLIMVRCEFIAADTLGMVIYVQGCPSLDDPTGSSPIVLPLTVLACDPFHGEALWNVSSGTNTCCPGLTGTIGILIDVTE